MTDGVTRLIRGNGVAESADQSPDPRTFWNQSRLCRFASGMGSLNALQPREFSGGCTGWPDASPADWRLLVLVVPRLVPCCDARSPILCVLPCGVRAHPIHLVALVERFDLLVHEAVVPLALCVAEVS